MLFGKKEPIQPQIEAKAKFEPYEVHVMPTKFHKYLAVKKKGQGRFILIFVIIFLVLGGITFGVFYFISQMDQKAVVVPTVNLNQVPNINLNENFNRPVVNENLNQNLNVNTNINLNENVNANENLNNNLNGNLNFNENLNTNINAIVPESVITYISSLDTDKDNLTDIEEELYNTEKRKTDTDEDGFIDGQEIASGYNPKAAGGALLETSGLVNKYINPVFNYEILQPAGWLARPTDQSLTEVIFQSATGEYIEVLVQDNSEKLDLVQWYLNQSPMADLNQLKREITKNGYDLLISPDRLNYYLVDKNKPEKIYIITYNIGNKTRVNFLTTFEMMKNSFKLKEVVSEIPLKVE